MIAGACTRPGAERTHVEHATHAGPRGGGEHVPRGVHVQALEGRGERGPLADDADKVDDRVAARHRDVERPADEHVALDALDRPEALQQGLRAAAHETADDVAIGAEGLCDAPAHEPRGARDEHPVHRGRILA